MNNLVRLGRMLYRGRSVIGILSFIALLFFANPNKNNRLPHLLVISGIIVRLWSAGYVGEKSRSKEIKADYRIFSGPYHILRHPLYIGNFFLVLGTILLYNPPLWFGMLLMGLFVCEYSIIILAEEKYLRDVPAREAKFHWSNLRGEFSTIFVVVIIYLLLFIRASIK